MTLSVRRITPFLYAAVIGVVLIATLLPYRGNVTALFHMDERLMHADMPSAFVVLDVPAYDGAQYYNIARNIPDLLRPAAWDTLTTVPPKAYGYQRFLLPFASFILSFGIPQLLPYAFVSINLLSIAGAGWLMRKEKNKWLYAFAIAFCPASMVGLHFMIAEPLALLLLTAFLVRFIDKGTIDWIDALLLSAAVITREVNILFASLLFVYLLMRRQWHDSILILVPFAAFGALHSLIYLIFNEWPFFMSTEKSTLPFEAVFRLLMGGYGYTHLTLTSIPLFIFFVLPALGWTLWLIVKKKERSFLALASATFLLLMTAMPDHIVGSITSIGRVITPVYPAFLLLAAKHDTVCARLLAGTVLLIGLAAGISLALVIHPYHLT